MASLLYIHGAKDAFRIPDGLHELCSAISYKVMRAQPRDIYGFIANYVDTLLITRENSKVAVRAVNYIVNQSESIVNTLNTMGLDLKQIGVFVPNLKQAFHEFLAFPICQTTISEVSIQNILGAAKITREEAEKAATIIQSAFRNYRERILACEAKGEVQWQRAAQNTIEILRKTGIPSEEVKKTAASIKSVYREYFPKRNRQMKLYKEYGGNVKAIKNEISGLKEGIESSTQFNMVHRDGINAKRLNQAAIIIQSAYRGYRIKKKTCTIKKLSVNEFNDR